jgi:hypothetical protein
VKVHQYLLISDDEWKAIHGTATVVRMIKNSFVLDAATDDEMTEIFEWTDDNLTGLAYIVFGPPAIIYFESKDDALKFKLTFPRE